MVTRKEGDIAPNFSVNDQHGRLVSLADFKGKHVILYFYPKDDTPGCTAEACNFRDHYQLLQEKGYEILGISADNEESHAKFAIKYHLPFKLLADLDKKIVEAYGVWVEKNWYGKKSMGVARQTFIIDPAGIIKKIIHRVDTQNATQQVLNIIDA